MKVYLITIDKREDYSETVGPYSTKEKAISKVNELVRKNYGTRADECLRAYGGNLSEGTFYSEEETYEIVERELDE